MSRPRCLRALLVLALAALAASAPQSQIETATRTTTTATDGPWFQTPSLPTSTVIVVSGDNTNTFGNQPHSSSTTTKVTTPDLLPSSSPSTTDHPDLVTYTDLARSTVVTATVVTTAPVPTYSVGVPPPMSDLSTVTTGAAAATISSDGFVQQTAYEGAAAPSLIFGRRGMWCFVGSVVALVGGLDLP